MVRTAVPPESLAQPLVDAVHAIDPEQPVLEIQPMQRIVEESLGQRPTAMLLLAGFATLALVLASVGIYSVLAYTVRQRVREIGIRMALGAPSSGVLRMVVVDGLKPTLAGVVLGLVLAAALVRRDGGAALRREPVRSRHVHAGGRRSSSRVGLVATLDPGVPCHPRRPDCDPAGE